MSNMHTKFQLSILINKKVGLSGPREGGPKAPGPGLPKIDFLKIIDFSGKVSGFRF